jgi:tetratricopeptide (TPR) repeat protein
MIFNLVVKLLNKKDNDIFEVIKIKKAALSTGVKTDYLTEIKICNFLQSFVLYLDKIELIEKDLEYLKITKKDSLEDIMNNYQNGSIEILLLHKLKILNKKVDKINTFDEIEKVLPLEYILNRRIGLLYENTKRYDLAVIYYKKTHRISIELFGKNSTEVASVLSDLTNSYFNVGDYSSAITYGKIASVIFSKISNIELQNDPEYELKIAKSLSTLGKVYQFTNPKESIKVMLPCLEILEKIETKKSEEWINNAFITIHVFDSLNHSDQSKVKK